MLKRLLVILLILFVFSVNAVSAENDEVRYEAEDGELYLCNNAGTHAAQIDYEGSYVKLDLYLSDIPGIYRMKVYYAAVMDGVNTHTIFVNDEKVTQISYPVTHFGWGSFSEDVYVEAEITLKTGSNQVRFERTAEDSGFAELDAISLSPITLYTPEPTQEPTASPAPTATPVSTILPTGTKVTIGDDTEPFNILYVIIPTAAVVAIVIILIIKKKAKR